MAEVLFYHLERQSLEEVLPTLLGKTLERGWRAVVEVADVEHRDALNRHLWVFREDSFLPHGSAEDGHADVQPIWLTTDSENPNGASVRVFAAGAMPGNIAGYERVMVLFSGADDLAVQAARQSWKALKDAEHTLTYWRQTSAGKWERKV
ncbi:MAG: DNA polymerase III subunit chi [Pseudomonadota bacterium]